MRYKVFVGSVVSDLTKLIHEIGAGGVEHISTLFERGAQHFYPLFDSATNFPEYRTAKVPDGVVNFVVVGTNTKFDYDLLTGMVVSLVPEKLCDGQSTLLTLTSMYGSDSVCSLESMPGVLDVRDHGYMTYLHSTLASWLFRKKLLVRNHFVNYPVAFDLMPVHRKSLKPFTFDDDLDPVTVKSIKSRPNSIALMQMSEKVEILSTSRNYKTIGVTPNYFFESHSILKGFKNIEVGVQ